MEVLLYRWNTTLRVVSDLMIALFFVVLASGRIAAAREQLMLAGGQTPPMRFSVGGTYLDANGGPDQAVRDADADMYRAKQA